LSGITPVSFSFTQKQVACNLNYKKQTKITSRQAPGKTPGGFVGKIGRGQE